MPSPFLLGFARHLVAALVREEQIDIASGRTEAVCVHLAEGLTKAQHVSLVSEVVRLLVDCDDVEELYATDDEVKQHVQDLDPSAARGG